MARTAPLCLTLGDPAGCGPAITQLAWRALNDQPDLAFYVRGAVSLYGDVPTQVIASPDEAAHAFANALPIMPLQESVGDVTPGKPDFQSAGATVESIESGVADVLNGNASGLVTNPVSKALLAEAGFRHPGHTEYLAELCASGGHVPHPVMMLVGGGLRVALATIHMPLRAAIDAITPDRLSTIARIVHASLKRDFAIAAPRLVFTGLNPHAGEGGLLGREEIEVINPAAEALRGEGIDIADARPGDTVFAEAIAGDFDSVIAMTHDQGLIPVKTLDMWGGVNATLGLPIIRTSPDHGTAYEATQRGQARADSLIAAIRLAAEMARARSRASNG